MIIYILYKHNNNNNKSLKKKRAKWPIADPIKSDPVIRPDSVNTRTGMRLVIERLAMNVAKFSSQICICKQLTDGMDVYLCWNNFLSSVTSKPLLRT